MNKKTPPIAAFADKLEKEGVGAMTFGDQPALICDLLDWVGHEPLESDFDADLQWRMYD